MTSPAYAHGFDGLGQYLGMSAKAARSLDARVFFPRCVLPGVIRQTVLFRLSEIDERIDAIRREKAEFTDPRTRPTGKEVRVLDVKRFADSMLNG